MKLVYFPIASCWRFVMGGNIITLAGFDGFFLSRREAVKAAKWRGLKVSRNGKVTT